MCDAMRNVFMAPRVYMQANCGACGKVCPVNSACSGGECKCTINFGDCNNDLTDGCEVDLTTTVSDV
jgi:hypothetical protein